MRHNARTKWTGERNSVQISFPLFVTVVGSSSTTESTAHSVQCSTDSVYTVCALLAYTSLLFRLDHFYHHSKEHSLRSSNSTVMPFQVLGCSRAQLRDLFHLIARAELTFRFLFRCVLYFFFSIIFFLFVKFMWFILMDKTNNCVDIKEQNNWIKTFQIDESY